MMPGRSLQGSCRKGDMSGHTSNTSTFMEFKLDGTVVICSPRERMSPLWFVQITVIGHIVFIRSGG